MNFEVEKPRLQNPMVVNAADFGFCPEKDDNSAALTMAIRYCKGVENCILEVPKGIYHIKTEEYITFEGMHDFIFDGGGAEFIFWKPNYFMAKNCHHIEIKNTIVDHNWEISRPGSLCRVTDTNMEKKQFEIEFLDLDNVTPELVISQFNQYDPVTLAPGAKNGKEIFLTQDTIISKQPGSIPNSLRITYQDQLDILEQGEYYLVRNIWQREGAAFLIDNCQHITLKDNTIYSSIGMSHVVCGKSQYFKFDGEKITLRPNTNRHVTADGDGIHLIQSLGYCIIENCDFSYMGDDDVNIHDCHFFVKERISDRQLMTENQPYGEKGDKIELRNPDFSPAGITLTLEELSIGADGYIMTFDTEIPENVGEGYILLNRVYDSSHYIIRNNYFHENRARGLLLQCSHGLVENNRFYHTQGAAIYVMLETLRNLWYEGSCVQDLTIRNNTFDSCNYADWSSNIDMIAIIPDDTSTYPTFEDVSILGNRFLGYPSRALYLSTADHIKINDNIFEAKEGCEKPIIAERCGRIELDGNRINHSEMSENHVLRVRDISLRKTIKYLSYHYHD
jgi:hypothetical protein